MTLGFFMLIMIPMTVYGFLTSVFKTNKVLMLLVLLTDSICGYLVLGVDYNMLDRESWLLGILYLILFTWFLRTSLVIVKNKIKEHYENRNNNEDSI